MLSRAIQDRREGVPDINLLRFVPYSGRGFSAVVYQTGVGSFTAADCQISADGLSGRILANNNIELRTNITKSSGLWYAEVVLTTLDSPGDRGMPGFYDVQAGFGWGVRIASNGNINEPAFGNTPHGGLVAPTQGMVISMAINAATGETWWRQNSGAWVKSTRNMHNPQGRIYCIAINTGSPSINGTVTLRRAPVIGNPPTSEFLYWS